MDLSVSDLLLCPQLKPSNDLKNEILVFDIAILQKQANLPTQFIWPDEDLVGSQGELREPVINLEGFFKGDNEATVGAAEVVRGACLNHGFFQVIKHGVDMDLIRAAHEHIDFIFNLPLNRKLDARKELGSVYGYSGAHAHRFSSKLPWKETLSFVYNHGSSHDLGVLEYFTSSFGKEFQETGLIYQKYCGAMEHLSLAILELLAISLGVERSYYRKFFEDGSSLMRCNYYPPCKESGLTLGTGPHCDPTSLTILHQDQVGGLEVFANNKWRTIRPRGDAFVINIGDTFMMYHYITGKKGNDPLTEIWGLALSNGRYQSCLHRALVNKESIRRSLAFFLCPKEDKVVRPPQDLVDREGQRKYPDFTWSNLLEFTQKHYRADVATLQSFIHYFLPTKHPN